jgi:hypothetical protein
VDIQLVDLLAHAVLAHADLLQDVMLRQIVLQFIVKMDNANLHVSLDIKLILLELDVIASVVHVVLLQDV